MNGGGAKFTDRETVIAEGTSKEIFMTATMLFYLHLIWCSGYDSHYRR